MRTYLTLSLAVLLSFMTALSSSGQQPFFQLKNTQRQSSASAPAKVETRAASSSIELSYTNSDAIMWSDNGISFNGNWKIGVAVVFPKEMLSLYVGCKVTKLSFGWNSQKVNPTAECFVRTDINGENIATGTKKFTAPNVLSRWEGSWNDVTLNNTYVLEADNDLVIGYFVDVKPVQAGESMVATCSNGGCKPGINYVMNCSVSASEGGNQWIDIYDASRPYPIFAKATLVDENGNTLNLCSLDGYYVTPVMKRSKGNDDISTGGYVKITNRGTNDITKFVLRYDLGDNEENLAEMKRTYTIVPSAAITPGQSKTITVPFYAIGSGTHNIKVATVNGRANKMSEPKPYTAIGVPAEVAAQYTMKPLVEYYCGENSHYTVRNFEDELMPGLAKHGDEMVVVNQHMNDQFMIYDHTAGNEYDDATTILIDFCDGDKYKVEAPVTAVNRTAYSNPRGGLPDNPATYVWTSMFVDERVYEPALATPTFASVDAHYRLIADGGEEEYNKMKITVRGNIADGVLPDDEQLYLSVYVMEDEVMTTSQEFPDDDDLIARWPDGVYYQQNVIRHCLTPIYGMPVGRGGEYLQSFLIDLGDEWKLDDMSIVAFLSRSGENDKFNRNVINTTERIIDIDTQETDGMDDEGEVIDLTTNSGGGESDLTGAICYGYAPRNPSADETTAFGTAMNNFIEAAICIDPQTDPTVARLKGSKLLGVRCFVREDHKQQNERWSGIWAREGNLDADATVKNADLEKGWNEVLFDTPVIIGDEPLYVGYKLFEQKGTPNPVISYSGASVNDGFYIKLGTEEGFQCLTDRGTLLIEAIIKPATADFAASALVQASGWPKAIVPDSPFDCNLYIRSQRAEEISSVEVTTVGDNGATVHKYDIVLDTPIAPFDAVLIPYTLDAPHGEGESVKMQLTVTGINGQSVEAGKVNTITLYTSDDAFVRYPLVEEFTGQSCVNCPFMAYYLDKALEKSKYSPIYVSHHAGFQDDRLTLSEDKDLLYLFGGVATFNPAVMFDRRMIPSCNRGIPVISATEAAVEPYSQAIEEVMAYPAMAKVMVSANEVDGKITCRAHGKIAKAMVASAENINLTVYLVEDDIKPEGNYIQNGVNTNVAPDAPADMVERFRHHGLIRIAFTGNGGDKIKVDGEGNFDVSFTEGFIRPMGAASDSYTEAKMSSEWNAANLRAVAFVHKVNRDELGIADNWVLNAGQSPLKHGEDDAVHSIAGAAAETTYYNMNGVQVSDIQRGVTIVRSVTTDGRIVTRKIVY